jgi:AraC-like DNA-binding protein
MFSRTTREQVTFSEGCISWWKQIDDPMTTLTKLNVLTRQALDFDWCKMYHVSPGAEPHRAEFCRDSHTLLVFDRGSFVTGERWLDGSRISTSGPLDIGIDVIPANAKFQALAKLGSNVACTVISIVAEGTEELFGSGWRSLSQLHPSVGLDNDILSSLADRLRQVRREQMGSTDSAYLESLCMVLVREVLLAQQRNGAGGAPRPTGGLSARAQKLIKEYLHDQDVLDQKIGLQELADLVGISRFHFTRAFKVSFGLPPHKYLLNLRLRKAADLLRTTDLPITSIALSVGFSCSSEFARAFKDAMDYSPRDFRQSHRSLGGHYESRVS